MSELKKVPVKIQGREYKISCTEEKEYIEKISYYVDKKIEQVMLSNPTLDSLRATTLVTLNLADSLFKAIKTIEKMNGKNAKKPEDPIYIEIEKLDKEGIPVEGTEKP